jgi:hypothetical protein
VREKGILVLLTADRYRISGVIYALLTAEKVDAMTAAFEEMAAPNRAPDVTPDPDGEALHDDPQDDDAREDGR